MLREKRRNDMYAWGERCREEERRRVVQALGDFKPRKERLLLTLIQVKELLEWYLGILRGNMEAYNKLLKSSLTTY